MKLVSYCSVALLLASSTYLVAQGITGDLSVRVTDPNQAAVPGVTLALRNVDENTVVTAASGEDGSHVFSPLRPGKYSLEVTADRFKSQRLNDITIQLGQRASLNVQLSLGTVSEKVEVSASAETLLNAESATTGQVLEERTVQDMPLDGRNFIQLALLSSGATPIGTGNSPASSWTGRSDQTLGIEGLRESNTSFLLNGIETRNARFGNAGIRPDPDAIQELSVQRGFFTPEDGGSAAILNTTVRNGTKDLHLVAFDLNRNRDFDANDYFANAAGQPRPGFSQNQFGATASGPIWIPKIFNGRNKAFFMFNYEGFRQREGLSLTGLYPSAEQLKGNIADNSAGTGIFPTNTPFCAANPSSQHCATLVNPFTNQPFPGNQIPTSLLNSISQKAVPYIPTPNIGVNPNAINFPAFNTFASGRQTSDFDQYNVRLDYTLSSKDTVYGTYSNSNEQLAIPSINFLGGTNDPLKDQLWTATWVRSISPSIINEFRFGHNDTSTYTLEQGANGPNYAATTFGLQNTSTNPFDFGIPGFGIGGFSGIGSFSEAIGAEETNFQYVDNLSISKRGHQIKLGMQIMHLNYFEITDFGGVPSFSFTGQFSQGTTAATNGLGDFLLGIPSSATASVGNSAQDMVTNYYGAYITDNWRVTPKLTINAGLRYEFERSPRERHGRAEYFDLNLGQEIIAGHGVRPEIIDPDYKNFAPRLGLAYQLTKSTVLRAGGGIYFATDNANEMQFEVVGAPFYSTQTITSTTPSISLNNLFPVAGVGSAFNPFSLNPRSRTPYVSQWIADIQQTFGRDNIVQIGYAGNTGQRLPQRYNPDSGYIDPTGTIPLDQREPFPQFGGFILLSENRGWSSYEGLTVRYEHRFNRGLSFLASYSWQKALDLGNTDDFSMVSADFKTFDKGHSDYDVPQRLALSYSYELPFGRGRRWQSNASRLTDAVVGGWQLNGITTFSAGQFHTVSTEQFWPNISSAFNTSVPNVIGNPTQGQDPRGSWFNSAAFAYPTQHIEGNAGRNQFEVPGLNNWDVSLFKAVAIKERLRAQLRVEGFNLFNHTQFGVPNMTWGTPTFGSITGVQVSSRRLQMGLRITF